MPDQVRIAGRRNQLVSEVDSALLIQQILRSLALSSFLPYVRVELSLLVCYERLLLLGVEGFVSG